MIRQVPVAVFLLLSVASLSHAQADLVVWVEVTNPDEPTLSAFLADHLSDCWAPAMPLPPRAYGLEVTIILLADDLSLATVREIWVSELSLVEAATALTAADSALQACPATGLAALGPIIPPDGMPFRLRAELIPARELSSLATSLPELPVSDRDPPITGSERVTFLLAVSGCWSVDVGSEAARVTLTVGFELSRDGKVIGDVQMLAATGGSDAAINSAYQAARRAVLRCQSTGGFQLPDDKYEQWRQVEMTFDPSGMQLR